MMAGPPLYESDLRVPEGPQPGLQPVPAFAADTSGIGKAVADLGHAGATFVGRLEHAQDTTRSLQAQTTFRKDIDGLEQQYSADPDYQTAPKRFADDVEQKKRDLTAEIQDPALRAAAVLHMTTVAEPAVKRLRGVSLSREHDDVSTMLDDQEDDAATDAAEATTPAERDAAVFRFTGTVRSGIQAGWISQRNAEARIQRFSTTLDQADLDRGVAADPVAAQGKLLDPKNYPFLDRDARARGMKAAQDSLTAADSAVSDRAERDGIKLLAAGKLTPDWLDVHADQLGTAAYRRFAGAIQTRPAAPPDPATFAELSGQVYEDPQGALNDAATALRTGKIDRALYTRLFDMASRAQDDAAAGKPWANEIRQSLVAAAKPSALQDRASAMTQLGAVAGFDQWLNENPKASPDEARAAGFAMVAQKRGEAAAADRQSLALPRFADTTRDKLSPADLPAIGRKLKDARDGKLISRADYDNEVGLLRRWNDMLGRAGGAKDK